MSEKTPPQIAVWLFLAATFVFASTSVFLTGAGTWLRITTLVVGLVLVILGGIQLGREISARKK
jgi:CHASE2 domain-containing sensor protein